MTTILQNSLCLAPMVELSHRALRELINTFGSCDYYYTEMTSSAGYLAGSPFDKYFLDCNPNPEKTIIQLLGNDNDTIIDAVRLLVKNRKEGNIPIPGINFNFGCSAHHIEKIGGGVRWMKDIEGSSRLFSDLKNEFPNLVLSAKMRLGYSDNIDNLIPFCQALEKAGADYLIIHPRLKNEKFKGIGHWNKVQELCKALTIPVIGNGDIKSFYDYKKALTYGVKGLMIGREAVRQPWIFSLIRQKETNPEAYIEVNLKETAQKMVDLIKAYQPKLFYISRGRRFFFYFCSNLTFDHHVRYEIQNSNDIDEMMNIFSSYFDRNPSEEIKIFRN